MKAEEMIRAQERKNVFIKILFNNPPIYRRYIAGTIF